MEEKSSSSDPLRFKIQSLVTKSRHYSAPMRKEAYTGLMRTLKELADPDLSRMLQVLQDSITKGFIDEDESVRGLFISLTTLILKRCDVATLYPFFEGWLQFCILSLTHIEPTIKRDGLIFLTACLDNKPDLLKPALVRLLGTICPGMSPRSTRPLKKGFKSETDLVLQLINLYVKTVTMRPDTIAVDYTWREVQNRSLRLVRRIPKNQSVEAVDPVLLKQIIERVLLSLSDPWLEMAENLVASHSLHDTIRDFIKFCRCTGCDEAFFWSAIPKSLINVLGRDGRTRLIDRIQNELRIRH